MHALQIFPTAGFDQSATTPVFIGVLVAWFFTETLGWIFAGLVVPGYLAALFVLDPRSATVNVVEAIITYGLSKLLGEHLARTGLTSRFFGRERFFLIVVVSLLVRLLVESVALQRLVPHATWAFSIGLVAVPLTANACWKTGLGRGLVQNGVPTLIVYLLLRYVLLPYTNLSLTKFNLVTENIALSFLMSPKAYIILLTGAVIAALANLRYGWDYNGILIPALLALVVTTPVKLAATLVEVVILLLVARALIEATPLGRWNIEGPRRPVLFFTLDYALRFGFAAVIGKKLPGQDVVDIMGFGYLLPTLLAVKISQKGLAALVVLPALAVSFAAFVTGTLVGFTAAALDSTPTLARPAVVRSVPRAPAEPAAAALWVSALARPEPAHGGAGPSLSLSPSKVAALVDELLADPGRSPPPFIEAQRLDGDVLLLRERFEELNARRGDPAVLARARPLEPEAGVVLVVPAPLHGPEAAALAGRLLAGRAARAVLIAGVEERGRRSWSPETRAATVARALAERTRRSDERRDLVVEISRGDAPEPILRAGASVARDPRLRALREAAQGFVGEARLVEDAGGDADASLEIPLDRAARWLGGAPPPLSLASATAVALAFDGAPPPATAATSARDAPEDLLALRRLVLEPLLGPATDARAIPIARAAASALGYSLRGPSRLEDGAEALALLPGPAPRPLAMVVRAAGVRSAVVEVPHGFHEGLRDFALRLDQARRADAVLIGLSHGAGLFDNDALREAHAVAVTPRPGRDARILLVRGTAGRDDGGVATISSWGSEDGGAAARGVQAELALRGIAARRAPLDLRDRDAAGRTTFGGSVLVAVTVDARAARHLSLDGARAAALAFPGLPTIGGPCWDAAAELAGGLAVGPPYAPDDLVDVARRAAVEHSVTARRELEDALARTATRAAFARSDADVFLVVVGRTASGLVAAAIPQTLRAPPLDEAPWAARSLRACAEHLATGGACRAEAP